jgi:hypothetical protein
MGNTEGRLTRIPDHASTFKLLLQLKPGAQNWDNFLLSAVEEILPPETVAELERRERVEKSRTLARVSHDGPGKACGQGAGRCS